MAETIAISQKEVLLDLGFIQENDHCFSKSLNQYEILLAYVSTNYEKDMVYDFALTTKRSWESEDESDYEPSQTLANRIALESKEDVLFVLKRLHRTKEAFSQVH